MPIDLNLAVECESMEYRINNSIGKLNVGVLTEMLI